MTTFILKSKDDAKQYIFGIANASLDHEGNPVVDADGDSIDPQDLEEAVYEYMLKAQVVGEDHRRMGMGEVIESVYIDTHKAEAMGMSLDPTTPKAFWFVGFHITDKALWDSIANGERLAFSIGGSAQRVP